MTINASRDGDGSHGGILAVTLKKYDNNVTIKGCVFDGKLLGKNTTKCGGLAGPVGGTLVLEDCLFLPSELTVDSDSSNTLARADDLSIYYCWYYDKYFKTKQGTQATLVSPGENVILNLSGRTYDASGLTVVGSGAEFGGRIYAKADVKLMFDISFDGPAADCANAEYTATSGTLTKTDSGYEFRSSGNDAVINVAKTSPKLDYQSDLSAYVVKTAKDWNILSGYSVYYITSNLRFVQTDDITGVTSVIGNSGNHFRGSYDGGGHTLNVSITGGSEERCVAPFSYIESAVIKNLRVEGSVNGYLHCAGLVGSMTGGDNLIKNVIVNAEITTTGTHCGGVIGHGGTSSTKLEGVVFTGKIEGGENVGAIWGWSDDKAEATLINCLEKGSYSVKGLNPVGLGNEPSSLKNVYHVSQEIGNPYRDWDGAGKRVFTVTADTGITVGFGTPSSSYSVSGITVYPAGIEYGGTFYVGEDDKITLSISGGSGIDGYTSTSGKLTKDGNKYVLTMPEDDVKIIGFRYGDVDGDGIRATLRDEILLVRYLSGWKSVQIIAAAADVDGDGKVTPKDAMILARHIAGWKGYEEIPYKP